MFCDQAQIMKHCRRLDEYLIIVDTNDAAIIITACTYNQVWVAKIDVGTDISASTSTNNSPNIAEILQRWCLLQPMGRNTITVGKNDDTLTLKITNWKMLTECNVMEIELKKYIVDKNLIMAERLCYLDFVVERLQKQVEAQARRKPEPSRTFVLKLFILLGIGWFSKKLLQRTRLYLILSKMDIFRSVFNVVRKLGLKI